MLSFLLEEGVITVGTISGLFTASLLNSFRINIVEPVIESIAPSGILDNTGGGIFPGPEIVCDSSGKECKNSKQIKWQTFLRDFVTWAILMYCIYLFWKHVIHKYKNV